MDMKRTDHPRESLSSDSEIRVKKMKYFDLNE